VSVQICRNGSIAAEQRGFALKQLELGKYNSVLRIEADFASQGFEISIIT